MNAHEDPSASPPHRPHVGPLERTLNDVESFHGHLGPYVILGLRMGAAALKTLAAEAYFGVHVKVLCSPKTPQSCLIDGLQLATGATLGKQNIQLVPSEAIQVEITDTQTGRRVVLAPTEKLLAQMKVWTKDGTPLPQRARQLFAWTDEELFVRQETHKEA